MFGDDPKRVALRDALVAALGERPPWWRVLARRRYDIRRATVMDMDVSLFGTVMRTMYPASLVSEMASRPLLNYAWVVKAPKGPQ